MCILRKKNIISILWIWCTSWKIRARAHHLCCELHINSWRFITKRRLYFEGVTEKKWTKKADELSFKYMAFFYFTYKFCWPDGLVSEVACRLENGLNVIFLYHIKHLTFNQSDKLSPWNNLVVPSSTYLIEWQSKILYAKELALLHIVSQSSMMRGWGGSSVGKVFGIHSCLHTFNAQHT